MPEPTMSARAAVVDRFQRRRSNGPTAGAPRTAKIYADHARHLDAWLTGLGDERDWSAIDPDTIDDFLADFRDGKNGLVAHAQSTVGQCYRSLRKFFEWIADRYETTSPMLKVPARGSGERRLEGKVLTDAQLAAVIDTVAHNHRDFPSVRDHALLRLLLTGLRRGELAALQVSDLDLDGRQIRVRGKGDASGERIRVVPFGTETQLAIDDYLELRERHRLAPERALWIGKRGVLTGRGLHTIVEKRGQQAGIPGIHPHMFRHTAAHRWLEDGGNEGHLMENMGWKSRSMVDHYAHETRAKRARDEYRRRGLDDRI